MTDDIKKGAKKIAPRIFLCSTEKMDLYPTGEAKVKNLLGHPEALVTDLSTVSDFAPTKAKLLALVNATGMEVTPKTLLWELAAVLDTPRSVN